jgi:maltoporin
MNLSIKKCTLALAAAGCITPAFAADITKDFEFSGYMRAAVGLNTKGGSPVCFGLPGADTKWRLGNECDYVIEPNLVYTAFRDQELGTWKVRFMPSAYRAYGQQEFASGTFSASGSPTGTTYGTNDLITRFNQVYVYSENIAALGNGGVWGGRRFYDRVQLGINDQFLENHDGEGAGIENVDLGNGIKASYAFLQAPRDGVAVTTSGANPGTLIGNSTNYEHAFRVTGIKTLPNSTLDIYAGIAGTSASKDQISGTNYDGGTGNKRIGFYHRTDGILGGSTFLGTKLESGPNDFNRWRVVVQQTGLIGKTNWDLIAEYRKQKTAGVGQSWASIGGRTDTHISGPFRFLAELGHDRVTDDGQPTRSMTKLTLATAVSAGKEAGSRPTLRLYYTYAAWNDAAKAVLANNWVNGERLARVFGNQNNGSSIGAQVEAWW